MRVLGRMFVTTIGGVLAASAVVPGPAGASLAAKPVSEERLLNVDYDEGLLTAKDAKVFVGAAAVTPQISVLGDGEWLGRFCNETMPQTGHSLTGRTVQYDPSRNASIVNTVIAFDSPKNAKQLLRSAQRVAKSCSQPYEIAGATFVPKAPPKVPKVGSEQVTLGGTYRFSNGQTADSMVIALQQDQVVDYTQMISTAPVTKRIAASIAKQMDRRLARTVEATEASKPRPRKKSRVSSCEEVLSKGDLERAFSVTLQEPDDCGYALAQGFGGVDVRFTTRDAADSSYPAIAKGEPIAVKGAADALYFTSTNRFGQVSETVYVRLKNGDMLTIGLRGDDVPKGQKVQLTQAAKVAVRNA
jgi:hypothetical protein